MIRICSYGLYFFSFFVDVTQFTKCREVLKIKSPLKKKKQYLRLGEARTLSLEKYVLKTLLCQAEPLAG